MKIGKCWVIFHYHVLTIARHPERVIWCFITFYYISIWIQILEYEYEYECDD